MQEIKYIPLNKIHSVSVKDELNLEPNRFKYYASECKRFYFINILLICFGIVKIIYTINIFGNHAKMDTNHSETAKLYENIMNLYNETPKKSYGSEVFKVNDTYAARLTLNSSKTTTEKSKTTIDANEPKFLPTAKTINDLPIITIEPIKSEQIKTSAFEFSSEQKYFINTSQCHIPFVEPFTPEIRKMFKPRHYTGCPNQQPIVTVSFDELEAHYILHINYTVAESLRGHTKHTHPIKDDIVCCYQEIIRSGNGSNVDDSFILLPCENFYQDFILPTHINGVIIRCKSKMKNLTLQNDALSFIQVNKTLMQQELQKTSVEHRKLSILLIGIDALSRINFRRNMPEMFKYLMDNKWFELRGYNKVGENTLPNLMPLLSGYTHKTAYDKCHPEKVGGFDNCNFIWNTFRSNGYHTAYAEDLTPMSTFNYLLKGFKNPPTDYYFRPIALSIEKSLGILIMDHLYYCIGPKQYGEYIYDYAMDFVTRYKNLTNFGFFWTNSFSHNSYDTSATMDKTVLNYFKKWQRQGVFENSVVMFFSDHGVRWGPLLKLPKGFLEQRLPMFFISLPKWFRQVYPRLTKNLEINQKRLTTPFDIYMTLQHLLKLSIPNHTIQQAFDCPKCQSLFSEIPENRTCDDASIPKVWCTCSPFKMLNTKSKVVQTVAKLIIRGMNKYYELKNLTSLCSQLQLNKITKAKMRYPDESKSQTNITTYAIDFITAPLIEPKASFSAIVDYDVQNKRIHLNIGNISRLSRYGNTAKCTKDKEEKKYCICKNSL